MYFGTNSHHFKELKVFASPEWLADSQKKYRKVFDLAELTYVYCELSFYNAKFKQEDCIAKIIFKLCDEYSSSPIGELETIAEISKDDNIVYVREGWGHEKIGAYWKEGKYRWEVFIEHNCVGYVYFDVQDVGLVTDSDNPYMTVQSVKLYEGPETGVLLDDRRYLREFAKAQTRYIWSEITAKNKFPDEDWKCEVFFYFFNDAWQLKGKTSEIVKVKKGQEQIVLESGWGSDHIGTWYVDNYTLKVVFMDTLIASVSFTVGTENISENNDFFDGVKLL